jgi:hypothetical protein
MKETEGYKMYIYFKFLRLLGVIAIGIFLLIGCCPFDSDCKESTSKAKKLQQKILQTMGIPYDIIVNVCQDTDESGFCENKELHAKVIYNLNKGEILWEKIKETKEGQYFVETYDREKPILLELQDAHRVNFNSGKFTLHFNGFKTDKEKEIKELSLLQSMIDAKYLTNTEAKGLRTLDNPYAQDKFYEFIFESLEKNLNVLSQKGFASKEAVSIDIRKMATKLIENNITKKLPIKVNKCTTNECIDNELNILSEILLIDENEKI